MSDLRLSYIETLHPDTQKEKTRKEPVFHYPTIIHPTRMKSAVVLALAGASAALTTPMISSSRSMICKRQDPVPFDPLLEVPDAWQFTLLSWSGSGCPDYPTKSYNYTPPYQETHMSSGPFMFNSSLDTYWWYIAYPFMEVQLPKESDVKLVKSTCTVEVAYQQTNEYGGKVKGTHRLRLHKNGTLVQANYQLDEGVSVEWQSRYYSATDETVVVCYIPISYLGGSCFDIILCD